MTNPQGRSSHTGAALQVLFAVMVIAMSGVLVPADVSAVIHTSLSVLPDYDNTIFLQTSVAIGQTIVLDVGPDVLDAGGISHEGAEFVSGAGGIVGTLSSSEDFTYDDSILQVTFLPVRAETASFLVFYVVDHPGGRDAGYVVYEVRVYDFIDDIDDVTISEGMRLSIPVSTGGTPAGSIQYTINAGNDASWVYIDDAGTDSNADDVIVIEPGHDTVQGDQASFDILITASDSIVDDSDTFTITVTDAPPIIISGIDLDDTNRASVITLDEGDTLTRSITASQQQLISAEFTKSGPGSVQISPDAPNTAILEYTPGERDDGYHEISVMITTVTPDGSWHKEIIIPVMVSEVNSPPVITSGDYIVAQAGVELIHQISFEDPDVIGGIAEVPTWELLPGSSIEEHIQSEPYLFRLVPQPSHIGQHDLVIRVSDHASDVDQNIRLLVQETGPTVTVTGIQDGASYNTDTIAILTFDRQPVGFLPHSISYTIDGIPSILEILPRANDLVQSFLIFAYSDMYSVMTLDIPAGAFTDESGLANVAVDTITFTIDTIKPVITHTVPGTELTLTDEFDDTSAAVSDKFNTGYRGVARVMAVPGSTDGIDTSVPGTQSVTYAADPDDAGNIADTLSIGVTITDTILPTAAIPDDTAVPYGGTPSADVLVTDNDKRYHDTLHTCMAPNPFTTEGAFDCTLRDPSGLENVISIPVVILPFEIDAIPDISVDEGVPITIPYTVSNRPVSELTYVILYNDVSVSWATANSTHITLAPLYDTVSENESFDLVLRASSESDMLAEKTFTASITHVDDTLPEIVFTIPAGDNTAGLGNSYLNADTQIHATFNVPVTGFTASDLQVSGVITIDEFVQDSENLLTYTSLIRVPVDSHGDIVLTIPADSFTNHISLGNTPASVSFTIDTIKPVITHTVPGTELTLTDEFDDAAAAVSDKFNTGYRGVVRVMAVPGSTNGIDTSVPGTQSVTYAADPDDAGNIADPLLIRVRIADTILPTAAIPDDTAVPYGDTPSADVLVTDNDKRYHGTLHTCTAQDPITSSGAFDCTLRDPSGLENVISIPITILPFEIGIIPDIIVDEGATATVPYMVSNMPVSELTYAVFYNNDMVSWATANSTHITLAPLYDTVPSDDSFGLVLRASSESDILAEVTFTASITHVDDTLPEVVFTIPAGDNTAGLGNSYLNADTQINATFNVPVTGFTADDLQVSGVITIDEFVQDSENLLTYTSLIRVPVDSHGDVTVDIPADSFTNHISLGNAPTSVSFRIDTTSPQISHPSAGGIIQLTLSDEFDEGAAVSLDEHNLAYAGIVMPADNSDPANHIDTSRLGTQSVTFTAQPDTAGNEAAPLTVTASILDTTPPTATALTDPVMVTYGSAASFDYIISDNDKSYDGTAGTCASEGPYTAGATLDCIITDPSGTAGVASASIQILPVAADVIGDVTITEGATHTIPLMIHNGPQDGTIRVSLSDGADVPWATADMSGIILSPDTDAVSGDVSLDLVVRVHAADGAVLYEQGFLVSVVNAHVIHVNDITIPEGATDSVAITSKDVADDTIIYDVTYDGSPVPWAHVRDVAGGKIITLEPTHDLANGDEDDTPGYAEYLLTVTARTDMAASATFVVTVTDAAPRGPPVIHITPDAIHMAEGSTESALVTVDDFMPETVTYELLGFVPWASIRENPDDPDARILFFDPDYTASSGGSQQHLITLMATSGDGSFESSQVVAVTIHDVRRQIQNNDGFFDEPLVVPADERYVTSILDHFTNPDSLDDGEFTVSILQVSLNAGMVVRNPADHPGDVFFDIFTIQDNGLRILGPSAQADTYTVQIGIFDGVHTVTQDVMVQIIPAHMNPPIILMTSVEEGSTGTINLDPYFEADSPVYDPDIPFVTIIQDILHVTPGPGDGGTYEINVTAASSGPDGIMHTDDDSVESITIQITITRATLQPAICEDAIFSLVLGHNDLDISGCIPDVYSDDTIQDIRVDLEGRGAIHQAFVAHTFSYPYIGIVMPGDAQPETDTATITITYSGGESAHRIILAFDYTIPEESHGVLKISGADIDTSIHNVTVSFDAPSDVEHVITFYDTPVDLITQTLDDLAAFRAAGQPARFLGGAVSIDLEPASSDEGSGPICPCDLDLLYADEEYIDEDALAIYGLDLQPPRWTALDTVSHDKVANIITSQMPSFSGMSSFAIGVAADSDGTDWRKKPTFGMSWEVESQQLVQSGFAFNGHFLDITDNWHTDFARTSSIIGQTNRADIKVYSADGLSSVSLILGVPEIGYATDAESEIQITLQTDHSTDTGYVISGVTHRQDENLVDPALTIPHIKRSYCNDSQEEMACHTISIDFAINAPLSHDVIALQAVDTQRRLTSTYLNHGIEFAGDSLLAPDAVIIHHKGGNQDDVIAFELVQIDRRFPIYVDQFGGTWHVNDFGTWTKMAAYPEQKQSDMPHAVMTRQNTNFEQMVSYEYGRALGIFDSGAIQGHLDEPYTIQFGGQPRIDASLLERMRISEMRAQEILESFDYR